MKLTSVLILLHLPFSFCAWAEVLERFWVSSCEFSPDVEKYLPRGSRTKRSAVFEEIDFDDPEEVFNYLYPLADMTPEDVEKEAGRSATDSSSTAYIWLIDLCHLWLAECKSRDRKDENKEEEEEYVDEDEAEMSKSMNAGMKLVLRIRILTFYIDHYHIYIQSVQWRCILFFFHIQAKQNKRQPVAPSAVL